MQFRRGNNDNAHKPLALVQRWHLVGKMCSGFVTALRQATVGPVEVLLSAVRVGVI